MPITNVLLTGGNGFVSVSIIQVLLQRGHSITTTVRSESKTTYLRQKFSEAFTAGKLRFEIVEDITAPGSFNHVIKTSSFDAVIHPCSPVIFEVKNVTEDILLPAIQGTTELLKAVKTYGLTVKRVVVTSSIVTMVDLSKGNRPGYVYSEKDWCTVTFNQSQQSGIFAYIASKIYSEKAAWEFMSTETPRFDLVTICPPMVYGPASQEVTSMSNLNISSRTFYSVFNGEEKEPTDALYWQWVDVRDVAEAHVAAVERPEAGGQRFLVMAGEFNLRQVVDYIWKHYPERALAKNISKDTSGMGYPVGGYYTGDNSASKRVLGLRYRSLDDTLKDQFEQFLMLEKKFESANKQDL